MPLPQQPLLLIVGAGGGTRASDTQSDTRWSIQPKVPLSVGHSYSPIMAREWHAGRGKEGLMVTQLELAYIPGAYSTSVYVPVYGVAPEEVLLLRFLSRIHPS